MLAKSVQAHWYVAHTVVSRISHCLLLLFLMLLVSPVATTVIVLPTETMRHVEIYFSYVYPRCLMSFASTLSPMLKLTYARDTPSTHYCTSQIIPVVSLS